MKEFLVAATICSALLASVSCENLCFPTGFRLGTGTSSFQAEGAWNEDGKSEGIWDHWEHNDPTAIKDASNGDVSADMYHKYKEDVQLVKELGLDVFRFTISWARVLPTGYTNNINTVGLEYYKNLTQELVGNGIKVMVTLHHLDHPQILEEFGGWTNETMIDVFVDYARLMFTELGDMVDTWYTVNQPTMFCERAYELGTFAPGKKLDTHAKYQCVHNALKAHAKVWHMYDEEFRPTQKGKITLPQSCFAYLPKDAASEDDARAVEQAFLFNCGWVSHPLYIGDYPEIMKTRIADISAQQGYSKSRLPEFTAEEVKYIKGTADFMGVNYYVTNYATFQTEEEAAANPIDSGVVAVREQNRTIIAKGLRSLLRQVRDTYDNPDFVITENGFPDNGALQDYGRISYYHEILKAVLNAITEDTCKVNTYMFWTLVDNFELNDGYTLKYGLYSVDFNSTDHTRTPRASAAWWKSITETRELQPVPESAA